MENSDIIRSFRLASQLMELHEENPFKIRSYTNVVFALEKLNVELSSLTTEQIIQLEGIGKSIADKINTLNRQGTFEELENLLAKTPPGVLEMMRIKGIGPKKIRVLWKELGLESTDALLEACENNQVAKLKGFGEKTQENIKQSLLFNQAAVGKLHYASAELIANDLLTQFHAKGLQASLTGQMARKLDIIDQLQYVIATDSPAQAHTLLDSWQELEKNLKTSAPFVWRGRLEASGLPVEIHMVPAKQYINRVFMYSSAPAHLAYANETGKSLLQTVSTQLFDSEEAIYQVVQLPYIVPELREGLHEFDLAKQGKLSSLIELKDLKGILHNHSTYSDGKHTLEEMALYCKELGYQYLGISDHSKSAFYANGLYEEKVRKQHAEIEQLNKKLAPFRIFKGIESDILHDGALDYEPDVLASFNFIVASVHSGLKMDEAKATQRLISAVENPYTTILGHPTGRLLLRREGYPINHRKVIDACAANGVVIEINANPWRLDIDWHWLPYALEKEVMISINPDAHEKDGYHDMIYGVHVARKGGLTKDMTFNALPLERVAAHFAAKQRQPA
ncbi:DNA polymerase/3'-5' exonuclease PolX [Rhodocytophaga rosea]|uniref:DNA polymerase/3'-5' exonuclease PolX n=1 Tax=Rhodocytophaga rosea TaxID=2704465 RepID=A0A6C0GVT3_9BACT|nr:DNA polymerase/3'-5' exonuclease PolX [Rhodocytophaga rosea]QHT71442.1 DNA polymerase/3'-5' exonuclease PolX [Rhodocytophaga rosea]